MEENKIKEYYSNIVTISQKDIEEYDLYSLRVIQDAISDFTKERKQINLESTSSQILLARHIFDRLQKQ
jgi:hypothetical protein